MKKIIALILAIVMMASMSVVAFAWADSDFGEPNPDIADTDDDIATLQDEDVYVKYTVAKGYVVEIPDDIELTLNERDDGDIFGTSGYTVENINASTLSKTVVAAEDHPNAVTIKMAKINKGETLNVYVTGNAVPDDAKNYLDRDITNNWMLKERDDKSAPIGYDIEVTGYEPTKTAKLEQGEGHNVVEYIAGTTAIPKAGRTVYMSIITEKSNQPGNFQDTLTFTVAITTPTTQD